MPRQTRRVVTGHDDSGKAVLVEDGFAPNVKVRKAGNLTSTLVWVTDETPALLDSDADPSLRETGVAPPPDGSILRIVDFPPAHEAGEVDNAAMLSEMGLSAHPDAPGPRHASMHRTRSIDYAIVMEGEIDMLLDDSEVHLKAGDVLIQKATNHAWVNRTNANCRIAFVLIDAVAPRAWQAARA
ncbi:MAG: cupin domain-containing protein [Beijerinckiaceae bacterium]|nr:cupin domain-containing protein [Beijerinckiaceae bacterium]